MIFVCPDEAKLRLPNQVPETYRHAAKRWRDFSQASDDADELGRTERTHWTYVIELSDQAGEQLPTGLPWVYVGQTSLTPEERFKQHLAGYKASPWVRKFGARLRPDLFEMQPPLRTQDEAVTYEAWLFAFLHAVGYPAKGGH